MIEPDRSIVEGGRIRVLIVEDEAEMRLALAEVVASDESLELVASAEDAAEGIKLAALHRPDVALVDVKMPEGGGPRATRGILRCSPHTRVIALSAHDDRESVLQMLGAGAVGYLVKGTSVEDILRTIRASVLGRGAVSQEVMANVIGELGEQLRREERERRSRRQKLELVRRAMSDGALRMVYQPIVDLRDGTVSGAEALARFDIEPPRGPDLWFQDAEEVGLLVDLELAALRASIEALGALPENVYLSVNLSPQAARSSLVADELRGAACERLVFEVTEHAQIEDYRALHDALADLRAASVRLAVDDAGAGFASLRHILELAPDFIKLDISLTRGIDRDRAHRALGAALISFAAEIGSTIVAEGIETRAELEALRDLGVRYGQGYHLARPGPLPLEPLVLG